MILSASVCSTNITQYRRRHRLSNAMQQLTFLFLHNSDLSDLHQISTWVTIQCRHTL